MTKPSRAVAFRDSNIRHLIRDDCFYWVSTSNELPPKRRDEMGSETQETMRRPRLATVRLRLGCNAARATAPGVKA